MLEFGGSDAGPFIQIQRHCPILNMKAYDWEYLAEPEDRLDGRRLVCPRGKVIGGSSSINGAIYVRGNPGDYQHWEDSAQRAGAMLMSCPISNAWNTPMAAMMGFAVGEGPCM